MRADRGQGAVDVYDVQEIGDVQPLAKIPFCRRSALVLSVVCSVEAKRSDSGGEAVTS